MVQFSLRNLRVVGVVGSKLSGALAVAGRFPQCTIYWVIKGYGVWCPVFGTLHIKDPLPFFKKSSVLIPVAGFSYHLIDSITKD